MLGDVARNPIVRVAHGFFDELFIFAVDGLVKSHMNICANLPLSLHGYFGIHANLVAIDVRFECDTIVIDFCIL